MIFFVNEAKFFLLGSLLSLVLQQTIYRFVFNFIQWNSERLHGESAESSDYHNPNNCINTTLILFYSLNTEK